MGRNKIIISAFVMLALPIWALAQRIHYSDPGRDDYRQVNFEIIGKVGSNIVIYKNYRSKNDLSIFDGEMKLKDKINLDFLPDKLINVDFVPYPDFFYMIYQYQKRNIVYCNVVKMDAAGQKLIGPVEIDTTQIGGTSDNKIYSTIYSEDKQHIMVFKINKRNERNYFFTTLLYNDKMEFRKKSRLPVTMPRKDAVFSDFIVDNEGDFVFTRCSRNGSRDNISQMDLMIKPAMLDTFRINNIPLTDNFLDEVKIKADNINKNYLISSLYYKQRRGNVEGIYIAVWDKTENRVKAENYNIFNDELKEDARSENTSAKTAFNDYFIRQVLPKKDGGFLIAAELFFTSSRGNNWNRYDYLYSPYSMYPYSSYNSYWSPYGMYGNPWNRWNYGSSTRYYSENIALFSFDPNASMEWSNILHKSQFDDNSSDALSYMVYNTGSEISFLYNQLERRVRLLSEQSVTPNGAVNRSPTLKNLNKDFEFLPKYGKQVGARQVVMPCMYRNYICFAKIDF
ncbi:hypothetical protein [Agriterribacter sp.]|uniref:hypothetical protein n=1 Tax=Agriterribacter sp. TaxID=2821509 RepID=UPI002CB128A0|nr:hypothetical protein [Agriterribacter sp.]HRO44612.1 hypothetical protein [Agriterribacter sp.]HRQ16049.1 hypothetical protein [Agriterribacter sp.]